MAGSVSLLQSNGIGPIVARNLEEAQRTAPELLQQSRASAERGAEAVRTVLLAQQNFDEGQIFDARA